MIEKRHLKEYKNHGFTIVENYITPEELKIAQWETLKLKRWYLIHKMDGKPRDVGTGRYWRGLERAGDMSPKLMELYTSKKQYDTATKFLETDEIYFFNDEIVAKYPNEEFEFMIHTDNEWGPDPEAAARGDYKLVNINWILDDITSNNGPISFRTKKKFFAPRPKAGDAVIFDGNTVHWSTKNNSKKVRRCWATQYTTKSIGHFFNNDKHPLPQFKGFYTERFNVSHLPSSQI